MSPLVLGISIAFLILIFFVLRGLSKKKKRGYRKTDVSTYDGSSWSTIDHRPEASGPLFSSDSTDTVALAEGGGSFGGAGASGDWDGSTPDTSTSDSGGDSSGDSGGGDGGGGDGGGSGD